MVKCLIRISTRVNVHLRMINHCYRDVKVRVLSLGPRLLGKALGVLPLYPDITSQQESLRTFPLSATSQLRVLSSISSGLESLRDSAYSTPAQSSSHTESFIRHSHSHVNLSNNVAKVISEDNYNISDSVLPTPVNKLTPEPDTLITIPNKETFASEEKKELEQSSTTVREPGEQTTETSASTLLVVPVPTEVDGKKIFFLSVLHLLLVTIGLLFVMLLMLLIIAESDLNVGVLHSIRQTPNFEQFHYELFCPLRRWFACKLHWVGDLLISN